MRDGFVPPAISKEDRDAAALRPHKWDVDGERCKVCGDKDWMQTQCSGPSGDRLRGEHYKIEQRTWVRVGFGLLYVASAAAYFAPLLCLPIGILGAASFLWGARKYPYE